MHFQFFMWPFSKKKMKFSCAQGSKRMADNSPNIAIWLNDSWTERVNRRYHSILETFFFLFLLTLKIIFRLLYLYENSTLFFFFFF